MSIWYRISRLGFFSVRLFMYHRNNFWQGCTEWTGPNKHANCLGWEWVLIEICQQKFTCMLLHYSAYFQSNESHTRDFFLHQIVHHPIHWQASLEHNMIPDLKSHSIAFMWVASPPYPPVSQLTPALAGWAIKYKRWLSQNLTVVYTKNNCGLVK